jgi:hypothetical protein
MYHGPHARTQARELERAAPGGGKKSSTTSRRPSFSSVYLGVRFIDLPASAPIASADIANDLSAALGDSVLTAAPSGVRGYRYIPLK